MVAVCHQESLTGDGFKKELVCDLDSSEPTGKTADKTVCSKKCVVVAWRVENAGSSVDNFCQSGQYLTACRMPAYARPDFPAVDKVTYYVESFGLDASEIVEERLGLRVCRAEMNVADKCGANVSHKSFRWSKHRLPSM